MIVFDQVLIWSDVSKYLYCTAQFNAGNMHGVLGFYRRKIKIIEGNAKCRRLNKLTSKGTLQQVFVCPRPRTPDLPPLTHCVRKYSTYSHREGVGEGGGRELNHRAGKRRNSSQSWVENTNMTDCISCL